MLGEKKIYKYLGIMEADSIKKSGEERKKKLKRVSQENDETNGNQAIQQKSQTGQKTRKLIIMHKALHPRDDGKQSLCVPKRRKRTHQHSRERRCIDATTRRLCKKAQWKTGYSRPERNADNINHQLNKDNHKTIEQRKTTVWTFHAANKRNLKRGNLTWLRKEKIKGGTQFLLIASQNNAIRTM